MKFKFTIEGEIEVPDGTTLPMGRTDVMQLIDGTILELDVNVEPDQVVIEKDIRYDLTFKPVLEPVTSAAIVDPSTETYPFGFCTKAEFMRVFGEATKTTPNAFIYNVVFGEEAKRHVSYVSGGVPLYNEDELETIGKRYETMREAVLFLYYRHGFMVKELEFIGMNGNYGVKFMFATPQGRLITQQYINSDPANLIPADFMHDLAHIPLRHY